MDYNDERRTRDGSSIDLLVPPLETGSAEDAGNSLSSIQNNGSAENGSTNGDIANDEIGQGDQGEDTPNFLDEVATSKRGESKGESANQSPAIEVVQVPADAAHDTTNVLSLAETIKLHKRRVAKPVKYEPPIEIPKKRLGHKKEKQVRSRTGVTAKVRSLAEPRAVKMELLSGSESDRSVFGSRRKKAKRQSASEEEGSDEEYGPTMTSRSAARERKRVIWEDDHRDDDDEGMEREEKKSVGERPSVASVSTKKTGVKRRMESDDSVEYEESDEQSCSKAPPKRKRGRPRKMEDGKGGKKRDSKGGRGMREDESDGDESGVPLAVRLKSAEIVKKMREAKRANLVPPPGWTKSVPADKAFAAIFYESDKSYFAESTYKLKNQCRFDYEELELGSEVYMLYEKYYYVANIVGFAPDMKRCSHLIEAHHLERKRKGEEAEKRMEEEAEKRMEEEAEKRMEEEAKRREKAEKRKSDAEGDEKEANEEEKEEEEASDKEESLPVRSAKKRMEEGEALTEVSDKGDEELSQLDDGTVINSGGEEEAGVAADFLMGDCPVDAVTESHEGGGTEDRRPDTVGQDTEGKEAAEEEEMEMREKKKRRKGHEERRKKRRMEKEKEAMKKLQEASAAERCAADDARLSILKKAMLPTASSSSSPQTPVLTSTFRIPKKPRAEENEQLLQLQQGKKAAASAATEQERKNAVGAGAERKAEEEGKRRRLEQEDRRKKKERSEEDDVKARAAAIVETEVAKAVEKKELEAAMNKKFAAKMRRVEQQEREARVASHQMHYQDGTMEQKYQPQEWKGNSTGSGESSKDKLVKREMKVEPMDEYKDQIRLQHMQQQHHPVQLVQQQPLGRNSLVAGHRAGGGSGSAPLPFPAPSHVVQQQQQMKSMPSAVPRAAIPRRPSDPRKQQQPSNGGVQGSAHPAQGQQPSQQQQRAPPAASIGPVSLVDDASAAMPSSLATPSYVPWAPSVHLSLGACQQQQPLHAPPGAQMMEQGAAAVMQPPQMQQGLTMTTASGASAPLPVPRPPDHVMAMLQERDQQQLRVPGRRVGGTGGGVMAPPDPMPPFLFLRDEAGRRYHGMVDYATGQFHGNLYAPPPLNHQGHDFHQQHQLQQMRQQPQSQQQQHPQHGHPDAAQQ